jgi:hypothetical protein
LLDATGLSFVSFDFSATDSSDCRLEKKNDNKKKTSEETKVERERAERKEKTKNIR